MRKLSIFNLATLDGYFAGDRGDISWHNVDSEFREYEEDVSNSGNTILFGRVTYELMASYWPFPDALKNDPIVAQLTQTGLIDEYQVLLKHVVLGTGKTMFEGIKDKITLMLINTRTFGNGNVLLYYEPTK